VPHPALDSREHTLALLAYCVSDVKPADRRTAADLDGVPLVPLADGGLGRWGRHCAHPDQLTAGKHSSCSNRAVSIRV
jgi:hypothetical protein